MKNFREKLKIDNIVSGIGCAVLLLFGFLSIAGETGLIPNFAPAAGGLPLAVPVAGLYPGCFLLCVCHPALRADPQPSGPEK